MKKLLFLFVLATIFIVNSCSKDKGSIPEETTLSLSLCDSLNVKYADTISTIIATHCTSLGCHVSGGPGNGLLGSYAGLKAKVDNGALKNRVITPQGNMPPSDPLSAADKQKIQCWLDAGAPNN